MEAGETFQHGMSAMEIAFPTGPENVKTQYLLLVATIALDQMLKESFALNVQVDT